MIKNKKYLLAYRRRWYFRHRFSCREKARVSYLSHRKQRIQKARKWQRRHSDWHYTICARWRRSHPEWYTVNSHFDTIFRRSWKDSRFKNYKNMPFFDGWNPRKGGSIKAGYKWIISNMGKRPQGCTLHIVDHEKGFVPGNLEWATPSKQSSKQMFKIIADLRHEVKRLQLINRQLRKRLTK